MNDVNNKLFEGFRGAYWDDNDEFSYQLANDIELFFEKTSFDEIAIDVVIIFRGERHWIFELTKLEMDSSAFFDLYHDMIKLNLAIIKQKAYNDFKRVSDDIDNIIKG